MAKSSRAPRVSQTSKPPTKTQPSPWIQRTTSLYLPLSPCAYAFPLQGIIAEHISPLLLTYYPPFSGVIVAFENARISEHPGSARQAANDAEAHTVLSRSIDEYAVTYVWLTVDFLVFQPTEGTYLEGVVTVQNESVLGLVCYNFFNAGIDATHLPKEWSWQKDGFVDAEGKRVEGQLKFRVLDFEAEGSDSSIQIKGALVES